MAFLKRLRYPAYRNQIGQFYMTYIYPLINTCCFMNWCSIGHLCDFWISEFPYSLLASLYIFRCASFFPLYLFTSFLVRGAGPFFFCITDINLKILCSWLAWTFWNTNLKLFSFSAAVFWVIALSFSCYYWWSDNW